MKETPPQLDASDMPDIREMTAEELALVPFDKWRLFCGVSGCNHYVHVKDYGLWPEVWGRFSTGPWLNVRQSRLLCHQHWKMYKSLPGDQIPWKRIYSVDEERKTIMEVPK